MLRALWVPTIWPACEIGGGRFPREQRLLEIVPITSPLTHKGSIISASRAKPRRTKTQAYRLASLGVAAPVNHRAAICRSSLSNQSSNPSIILVSNWLAAVSLRAMASAVLPSDTPPNAFSRSIAATSSGVCIASLRGNSPPRNLYRFFHPQTLSSARGSSSQCRQVSSFICYPTAHDHRCQSDRRRRSRGGNRRCAPLHQSAAAGQLCRPEPVGAAIRSRGCPAWAPRVIGRGFRLKVRRFRLVTAQYPRQAQMPSRSLPLFVRAGRFLHQRRARHRGQVRSGLVWGFSCQAVVLGCADSFLFGAGKAVFRPVACDQVRGARGRGQGTETVAKLGGFAA